MSIHVGNTACSVTGVLQKYNNDVNKSTCDMQIKLVLYLPSGFLVVPVRVFCFVLTKKVLSHENETSLPYKYCHLLLLSLEVGKHHYFPLIDITNFISTKEVKLSGVFVCLGS